MKPAVILLLLTAGTMLLATAAQVSFWMLSNNLDVQLVLV
jgi:hypothetical protein